MRNKIIIAFVSLSVAWSSQLLAPRIDPAVLGRMKPSHIERLLNDARRQRDQALVKQLEDYLGQTQPAGKWYWLPSRAGEGQWAWIPDASGVPVTGPSTSGVVAPVFIGGAPTITQPITPPEGAVGPGQWRWFSLQEGQGQWGWMPEQGHVVIGGPTVSPGGQIIAQSQQLPGLVRPALPQPTGIPALPAGSPPIPGGVQPPAGPSLEEQLAAKKRAESVATRIVQPLDAAALRALTQQERDLSDQVIHQAIKKIAHEVFIKPENVAQKTKVTVGEGRNARTKELDTPFLAYQWFIKEVLIQDVGMDNQFKKRQELIDLLGEEDAPGPLFEFIDANLKKQDGETLEQFLMRVKNNVDRYTTDMLALFEPCVFNVQLLRQQEIDNIRMIVVNVAVTQRPSVKVNEKEIRVPTPLERALTQRVVENMFKHYIGELRRAGDSIVSLEDPLLDDHGNILLKVLRDEINLLRLNPEFYRFDVLTGSVLRERAAASRAGTLEFNIKLPLLDLLDVYDVIYINGLIGQKLKLTLDSNLFFDLDEGRQALNKLINFRIETATPQELQLSNEEIDAITNNNNLFKKAADDYIAVMKGQARERREALDPYELINEQLKNVIQFKDIKATLQTLKKLAGTPDRNKIIDAIIKELDHPRFAPNVDQIIDGFKQLTNRQQLEFEQNVRKRINAFIEQKKNVTKVLDIFTTIINLYKARTPSRPIGQELIQTLEGEGIPLGRFKERLKGVKRTAQTVYEALRALSDGSAVTAIMKGASLKEVDFYKLIEPYGLLMMILEGWSKKALDKTPAEQLNVLFNSLRLLNSPTDKFVIGDQYVEGLVPAGSTSEKQLEDYKDLIYARVYAGKLTQLINNLELFQFDAVRKEIQQLVAAGGVGAENTPEFDTIVTEFQTTLAQVLFKGIVEKLTQLNRGETSIEGLSVSSYVDLYVAMRGQLTSLLNILAPGGNPITDLSTLTLSRPQINLELDTLERNMAQYLQPKAARDALGAYLGRLKRIFANLGQFIPAATFAIPAPGTGDGVPLVPPGGPSGLPPIGGPPVPAGGPRI